MRGGSSKALFFHEKDVPPPGADRDEMLKRVMGTPDPLQIDGMGGTKAVTSKVAIIKASSRADADVDYTFAQVGVNDNAIGYKANCGNISSAVGPFAIEEGLISDYREGSSVDPKIRTQAVRIYNTNTDKVLTSHVPVDDAGAPIEKGDYSMAAVPGTGAPILMDYVDVSSSGSIPNMTVLTNIQTVGACLQNGVLPTGNLIDTIQMDGKDIELTICDVGNPMIFFKAEDLGMTGHESADEITENTELLKKTDELRGKAAQLVGLCKDWTKVDEESPFLPCPVAIAKPNNKDAHIEGRLFLDHMCHESMAGSGGICIAACSRVPGTLVNKTMTKTELENDTLHIAHPVGVMPVLVKTKEGSNSSSGVPEFETLSFMRTARRIMEGRVLIPEE